MFLRGGPRPRSHLPPHNRELRQAVRGEKPVPFGARRPLDERSQDMLKDPFETLLLDKKIPPTIEVRKVLSNTLLPKSWLDKQLGRGIIIGHEFAKRQQERKASVAEECNDTLVATLGGAIIIQSRTVALELFSANLDREHGLIGDIFEEAGIVRPEGVDSPPHVSLGDTQDFMSKTIQEEVIAVMNKAMPVGEDVLLLPIKFYSGKEQ